MNFKKWIFFLILLVQKRIFDTVCICAYRQVAQDYDTLLSPQWFILVYFVIFFRPLSNDEVEEQSNTYQPILERISVQLSHQFLNLVNFKLFRGRQLSHWVKLRDAQETKTSVLCFVVRQPGQGTWSRSYW